MQVFIVAISLLVQMVMCQTAKVLIYSATNGYRHDSIPAAISALQQVGPQHNIQFDATEDSMSFTDANLAQYDGILFLMNTDKPSNDILDPAQQSAFQNYLNAGGNFIGVHSASDCLHNATFYQKEIGAYFQDHPPISITTFLNNIEPNHPTVNMLPERWSFTEEVYNFKNDPREFGSKVVLTVEQSGGDQYSSVHGSPHPIAWYQERGGGVDPSVVLAGRSFYTSLGHLSSTWGDSLFILHVMGGITWALGANTTLAFNVAGEVGNGEDTTFVTEELASSTISTPFSTETTSSRNEEQKTTSPSTTAFLGLVVTAILVVGVSV